MTALQTPAAAARPAAAATARVFWAVLRRDLYVTGRELPVFLAQVVLQPLGGRGGPRPDPGHGRAGQPDQRPVRPDPHPAAVHRASQHPWASLDQLRWFQVLTACLVAFTAVGIRLFLRRAIDGLTRRDQMGA